MDSALKKNENYYLQVVLQECKYIEKKLIRHITDDLESSSDDSDEEYIKAIRLVFLWESNFESVFFGKAILKNVFYERAILKMPFLRGQF